VATVVIPKWSRTFDASVAERHLYPERYPEVAKADAALADGNLLGEDANERNPHTSGIPMVNRRLLDRLIRPGRRYDRPVCAKR
jgi:aerobic C4-dicarboxylate transport protein